MHSEEDNYLYVLQILIEISDKSLPNREIFRVILIMGAENVAYIQIKLSNKEIEYLALVPH